MKAFLVVLALFFLAGLAASLWPIFLGLFAIWLIFKIYESMYYKSKSFDEIKQRISSHIYQCNELNAHIEELKETGLIDSRVDYGRAAYRDNSKWNMKRKELQTTKYAPHQYDCSRTVCDSARKEPFKYICKYFNIAINEETLDKFEAILNNFEAAEDGKISLKTERENIFLSISNDVPYLIRKFGKKKLEEKLGFEPVDLSTMYFPRYIFRYTSSGGNASTQCDIVMDIDNLNQFVEYLSSRIKFNKSVAGQRALMTSRLRQHIKERDAFTCKHCGVSTAQEPHLLLEIDHIVPVSKGGLTCEDNLQTLCWKCNRTKGAKI